MFDIGFSEMVLLGVIALIAIGPKQLPDVARKLARFINDMKRVTNEFTGQLMDARESANRLVTETKEDLLRSMNEDGTEADHSGGEIAPPQPAFEAMPYKVEPVVPPPFDGPLPEPDPGADLSSPDPYHQPSDGVPEQMGLSLESPTDTKPVKGSDER
jgi:sec-independent protein translocase protein TatB